MLVSFVSLRVSIRYCGAECAKAYHPVHKESCKRAMLVQQVLSAESGKQKMSNKQDKRNQKEFRKGEKKEAGQG